MGIDVGRIANEDRRRREFLDSQKAQAEAMKQQAEAAKRQADAAQWQAFRQTSTSQQYSAGSRNSTSNSTVSVGFIDNFQNIDHGRSCIHLFKIHYIINQNNA